MPGENSSIQGIVKSMGLVFGDIGTSPIYALTAIFLLIPATPGECHGDPLPDLLDADNPRDL